MLLVLSIKCCWKKIYNLLRSIETHIFKKFIFKTQGLIEIILLVLLCSCIHKFKSNYFNIFLKHACYSKNLCLVLLNIHVVIINNIFFFFYTEVTFLKITLFLCLRILLLNRSLYAFNVQTRIYYNEHTPDIK